MRSDRGASVLVVDDRDALRRMLRAALERTGFHVLEAATELDLQRQLARQTPDALLLNLQRARADGLSLLIRLRGRQTLSDVPIVFLAGSEDDDFRRQVLHAGADAFGLRPMAMRGLGELIRDGCSAHHDVRQLAWHDDDPLHRTRGHVRLNAG